MAEGAISIHCIDIVISAAHNPYTQRAVWYWHFRKLRMSPVQLACSAQRDPNCIPVVATPIASVCLDNKLKISALLILRPCCVALFVADWICLIKQKIFSTSKCPGKGRKELIECARFELSSAEGKSKQSSCVSFYLFVSPHRIN